LKFNFPLLWFTQTKKHFTTCSPRVSSTHSSFYLSSTL